MLRRGLKETNAYNVLLCFMVTVILLHTLSRNVKVHDPPKYNGIQIVTKSSTIEGCNAAKTIVPVAFGNIISETSKTSNPVVRYGTRYGGFNLPGNDMCWLADPGPNGIIVYSFGVGEDCSWDIALASLAPGKIKIFLFDPTPRAKEHFDAVIHTLETKQIPRGYEGGSKREYVNPTTGGKSEISSRADATKWFQEVADSNVQPMDLSFHPYGLWINDTQLEFFAPNRGVSHSFTTKGSGRSITVEARKLSTLMKMLSHNRLDVLKFDVEGAEVLVVPEMVKYFKESGIWPRMILFDHDSIRGTGERVGMEDVLRTPDIVIETLLDAGYRLFSYYKMDAVFLLDE